MNANEAARNNANIRPLIVTQTIPFNVSKGLISGCNVCGQTTAASNCNGCKVVSYCTHEHQSLDWPAHKQHCSKIKKARTRLEAQEIALSAHPGDTNTPRNALDPDSAAYGNLWTHEGTRPYMKARYELVDALLKINTKRAVEAAFAHCKEMLRLNRTDNQGISNIVPALFLRLAQDHECYSMLRFTYIGPDPSGRVDAMEPVSDFLRPHVPLAHLVALVLIKVRLFIDVRRILARTQSGSWVSGIMGENHATFENGTVDPRVASDFLQGQIVGMVVGITVANEHFWPVLLSPSDNLTVRPHGYTRGSKQEMQIVLQHCYNAWFESEGSFEVVREVLSDPDVRREMTKEAPGEAELERRGEYFRRNPGPC